MRCEFHFFPQLAQLGEKWEKCTVLGEIGPLLENDVFCPANEILVCLGKI